MTEPAPVIVIKIGGSLFDLPDLAKRLSRLFEHFSENRLILVAGGGAAADAVRELQPVHSLSDAAAHRIAMASLRLGEQLLQELFPKAASAETPEVCDELSIANATKFVQFAIDTGAMAVSEDWSFTSDSIAALIAQLIGAEELVLVKSVPAPSLDELGSSCKVDAAFINYANGLNLHWCDLRRSEEPTALQ